MMWNVARVARWVLLSTALALAAALVGAIAVVAPQVAPTGTTFGWPFRVTGRTNVLIMGLDRTVSDSDPNVVLPISRTDALVAASFDPASRQIYLLSIPRDTQVAIPGHGTDKINAAHAYGGAALTLRTVQNFLGVPFPYYIEVTARGLVRLVDAVGGVNIRIEKDLNYDDNWDGLHIHLRKGYRRLGGKAAIEFTRFRHDPLGDIGRIQRQQELFNALLDELRRPRVILRMARILRVFREDITTNLQPSQLITLAWFGTRLPGGGFVRGILPGRFGDSDWIPDARRDREVVALMFLGVDPAILAGTTVEVINASAIPDALTDSLARLAALGVRVVRIIAVPDAAATAVIVQRGDPRAGRIVAAAVEAPLIIGRAGGRADLTLVLGRDYLTSAPPARRR